jgi:hypothetical protein
LERQEIALAAQGQRFLVGGAPQVSRQRKIRRQNES